MTHFISDLTSNLCNKTTQSTANGNWPNASISFPVSNAVMFSPTKKGQMEEEPCPGWPGWKNRQGFRQQFTSIADSGTVRSLKCCGLKPSEPPDEPLGKELIDLANLFVWWSIARSVLHTTCVTKFCIILITKEICIGPLIMRSSMHKWSKWRRPYRFRLKLVRHDGSHVKSLIAGIGLIYMGQFPRKCPSSMYKLI